MVTRNAGAASLKVEMSRRTSSGEPTLVAQATAAPHHAIVKFAAADDMARSKVARDAPDADVATVLNAAGAGSSSPP